jgi:hypothetical protein
MQRALLGFTTVALLSACPAGKAADTIKSDQPTVSGGAKDTATGEISCEPDRNYDVLAVDWEPEQRGDLEVAMKQGVVAVSYGCGRFEVLDCAAEGGYGFIGMSRKEKVVKMKDADEVKANLPLSAIKWLSDLGGELARGTSLDAAMVMIGVRKSNRRALGRDELDGDCERATHYVSSATLGAFVLATGSAAKMAAAASFFGKGASAGSSSDEQVHNKEGSIEACDGATPEAAKPPAQCGAPLRLVIKTLAPSADKARAAAETEQAVSVDVTRCPDPLVMVDGACVKESDQPHQCAPGNASDCQAQCEAGDAESCSILGSMHWRGDGVDKDWGKSVELHREACDKGVMRSCRYAGNSLLTGRGAKKDLKAAAALLDKACVAGDGIGCVELGRLELERDNGDVAVYKFRRACYGGEYVGCAELGVMYKKGAGGLRANPKIAAKFFEKGCKEGSPLACAELAEAHRAGKGVKKDRAKAKELYARACNRGYETACNK